MFKTTGLSNRAELDAEQLRARTILYRMHLYGIAFLDRCNIAARESHNTESSNRPDS